MRCIKEIKDRLLKNIHHLVEQRERRKREKYREGQRERERGRKTEREEGRTCHSPTILTVSSAWSSPAGLVTVMVYFPSSLLSAPSMTKLLRFFLVSTRTRPSASVIS